LPEYFLTDDDREERDNLLTIARYADAATRAAFESHPPGPGMVCAEIGAGAGTIASWLCRQVGPAGRVVATDFEVKWLELLDEPNLEVRRSDIVTDPLGEGEFDLVHARNVLIHVDASAALANIVAGLRPGGRVLVEENDLGTPDLSYPPVVSVERLHRALAAAIAGAGGDPNIGRKLPHLFHAAGLSEIEARFEVPRLTPERLASGTRAVPALVNAGLLPAADAASLASLPHGDETFHLGGMAMTIWGRKPTDR